MDLDFLEYDYLTEEPVAAIETKYALEKVIDTQGKELKVLVKVANKLGIPAFCLVYYPFKEDGSLLYHNEVDKECSQLHHIQFYVVPLNEMAKQYVPLSSHMSEKDWVSVLSNLHGEPYSPSGRLCGEVRQWDPPKVLV